MASKPQKKTDGASKDAKPKEGVMGKLAEPSGETDEKIDEANIRMVPEVDPIPRYPIAKDMLFNENQSLNLKNLKAHFSKEGRLRKEDALKIVKTASALLEDEPNLLRLRDPITVCGDVHGQFFDLIRLMDTGGDPARTKYLFLGDYVDRGCFSTEVVFFLFAHKITYHRTFFMLRGNHECRHLTQFFNFRDECIYKYDIDVYDAIMNAFDNLPLAATINHKFLCIHGGLSPDISTLKDITEIERKREVPREGPFCDLLWADPYDDAPKAAPDGELRPVDPNANGGETTWFSYNEARQCSYVFGIDATKQFLKRNGLTAVIRAHEAQLDGYKFSMTNGAIPRVVTIFSAPNYCDVYKNKGACLQFHNDQLKIRQFGCSPHPYYLPNFMDVFTWSLPFMSEKVTDMVYQMLDYGKDEESEDESLPSSPKPPTPAAKEPGHDDLILKLKIIAKFKQMSSVLKDEREKLLKLKQLSPNQKLPSGLLSLGSKAIDKELDTYTQIKAHDLPMEAMPTRDGQPGTPGLPHRRLSGRSFKFKSLIAEMEAADDISPHKIEYHDEEFKESEKNKEFKAKADKTVPVGSGAGKKK